MPDRPTRVVRSAPRVSMGLGLLIAGGSAARAARPRPSAWRTDCASAQVEARALNRPLWLQFTGPWCQYCRQMERESFARPDVVSEAGRRVIPVSLRPDLDDRLAQR